MQEITIDGKVYTITFKQGGLEVEHQDEGSGLNTVYEFKKLEITDTGIQTEVHQFQVTPTGERIDRKVYKKETEQVDYEGFIAQPITDLILKYVTNGIFRFLIKNTEKIYDSEGNLIVNQPVFPNPEA